MEETIPSVWGGEGGANIFLDALPHCLVEMYATREKGSGIFYLCTLVILLHWVAPFSHTAIGLPYLQV
jgi:hypothetical protein